jgi:outer membrane protein assembly factor BamB
MPETTQFGGSDDNFGDGTLKANTILINRYRIMGMLGGGGQGAVYQARDLNFPEAKRLVAIKEMHYPSTDPNQRAATFRTFQREANILATLAHPAIPKIFDFFDQNNRAYLVQEFINGSDLEMILSKTKELPMDRIIGWAIDLCDVLDYLHNQKPEPIIFRDIKPANIMIDHLGKIRLIDFGIAKKFVSGIKHTMIGTEGYSAPEQYKGDVTPLSDIYSLGATLHHIITRRDPRLEPPFSFNERPITEEAPETPSGLVAIVDRALEMEPGNRFQSCAEMKTTLETLRYGGGNSMSAAAGAGNNAGTGLFDDLEEFSAGAVTTRWTFKTEDEIRCSPTVYRDMVFIGSYDTNVWAVNREDGKFIWKFPTQGGIASSPIVDRDSKLVLFGSEDHTFNAVDYHNGRINWSHTTQGRIRSTPRLAHGHVFFGSDDGYVYALVASNGRSLWRFEMGSPVRSQPFVTNDLVIVGSESGEVVALELSGERKWSRPLRRAASSPFVDEDGICYVGGFDGFLYALDSSSGYILWRFRTTAPIIGSPIWEDDWIFFGSADTNFYAVNAESGKEKWRYKAEKSIVSSPVIRDGSVYFGATDGYLYCLEAKTGKEQWKFQTGGPITSSPYLTDELILVGSIDHTLYALPLVTS